MRLGGRGKSRRLGGNGRYFGSARGPAAARPERPSCLVVGRGGLTQWLGVRGARGGVSDRDGLNDFLRFVLDEGEDKQHAQTANSHTKK